MIAALLAGVLLAAAGVGYWRSIVSVDGHEQAVLEVDGDIRAILDPGTHVIRPVGRTIHFYNRRVRCAETEAIVAGEHRSVAVNWEITSVRPLHETDEEPDAIVKQAIDEIDGTPEDGELARRVEKTIRPWGTVVGVELLSEE